MLFSYEKMLVIHKYLIFLTLLFSIIDSFVLFEIQKKQLDISNQYAELQSKYSFLSVTAVKVILLLFLFYLLLHPPGNAGAVGAIAIVYCLVVAIFIKDFLKAKKGVKKH